MRNDKNIKNIKIIVNDYARISDLLVTNLFR